LDKRIVDPVKLAHNDVAAWAIRMLRCSIVLPLKEDRY